LKINPFSLPHDATETYGFILRSNGVKISYATDLGFASKLVKERMKESDILIIEANHDMEMLKNGPYPWFLKQRLIGQQGHLSNESMGELVEEIIHEATRYLILAHLSTVNNRPELARREALKAASQAGANQLKILVSSQNEISELIQI
jgi:phosphoribosyl 1,2-cyclic phosphodiesterase